MSKSSKRPQDDLNGRPRRSERGRSAIVAMPKRRNLGDNSRGGGYGSKEEL